MDDKGRKSVIIAPLSDLSHSTIGMILKGKNTVREAVKGFASLKALRIKEIQDGPCEI